MKQNIHAVIFDFGGVLIGWEPRLIYQRHFPDEMQNIEQFFNEVNFMEWNAQQDKGRPFAEGVKILSAQFPQYARFIRAYHEHWRESITGVIPQSVELLQQLHKNQMPLYGLSTWSAETFPTVRDEFEFWNLFNGIMLSGEVKMIKPEPEIFHACLKMVGKPAQECLFIDDSLPNIQTAQQLGFETIHFASPEQLKRELQSRNLL